MNREQIMAMNDEQLDARASELAGETRSADSERLTGINQELDWIEERRAQLVTAREAQQRAAAAVVGGAGTTIGSPAPESTPRTNAEIRNSAEYIEAFANYVRTGNDMECRALLTENVPTTGTVPVPELVESRVRNAWENDEIFSRVARTYVRGNLKVGFEISATDAEVHAEGAAAPAEETLVLGIVNMVPANIKKWITVSDEVLALGAEEFLAYIYDELTYKIIQKAADIVVQKITGAPGTSSATQVGVAKITGAVTAESIIDAIAELGDAARDIVLIASGQTIASVRKAALQANYAYDPFDGIGAVIKKSGVTGAIVGDLSGVQANLPEGDSVTFKFDDLSLAEKDMVKIVGRLFAAIEVVGPKMFAVIQGE